MEHPEATHLFLIDADIEFDPNDLLRMVAYDRPHYSWCISPKKQLIGKVLLKRQDVMKKKHTYY